jgi:maleylpyruvate isomerase
MDEVNNSLARIAAATDRLLATASTLTDAQMRGPSSLPGWTRGHVLTHIARNADGLGNLLGWARTGTEIPMYASADVREADIEAGAGRSAADLVADIRVSATVFAAEASSLSGGAWTVSVRALNGPPFPALGVLDRRLSEVEIHHVDLAAGCSPGDWPADFVANTLPRVADSFTGRLDAPPCQVQAAGSPALYLIGPEQDEPPRVIIHGPPAELLGWLTGRGNGDGLTVVSGDALPELPPWR